MVSTVLEKVKSRKFFYRDLYRKELVLLIALIIMSAVWIALIIVVAANHLRTVPYFYASSSDGILTPLTAMSQPNRSDKAMLQ
jgi:hypothetical protein